MPADVPRGGGPGDASTETRSSQGAIPFPAPSSLVGTRLSHYEVLSYLGRGGMGVVYRALDTKLRREVALKILAAELVDDPRRKAQFLREAQGAAASIAT